MALANLTNPNCHPNEGGVGPCVIFGGNVGDAAHMAVTEGWLTFIGGPIAFGTFVIYLIVMTIIRTVSAYRKTASAR